METSLQYTLDNMCRAVKYSLITILCEISLYGLNQCGISMLELQI